MNVILDKQCNLQRTEPGGRWYVLISRAQRFGWQYMPGEPVRLYGWLTSSWTRLWR
jgi:hypothetical protein